MLVITEDFRGLTSADAYFEYAAEYVEGVDEPLERIGRVVLDQIRERFHDHMGAAGTGSETWVALSEPYWASEEKMASLWPDAILMKTGQLYIDAVDPTNVDVDGDELTVGIDNPLAELHHEGTGRMPARPIWDDNPEWRMRADEIAWEWLRDLKRKAPPTEDFGGAFDSDYSVSDSGRRYYNVRDRGRFTKKRRFN